MNRFINHKSSLLFECQGEALIKSFFKLFANDIKTENAFTLKISNLWQRNSTQISGAIPAGELCFKELL